jgi:energy-converting hydrogenase Eha subunit B
METACLCVRVCVNGAQSVHASIHKFDGVAGAAAQLRSSICSFAKSASTKEASRTKQAVGWLNGIGLWRLVRHKKCPRSLFFGGFSSLMLTLVVTFLSYAHKMMGPASFSFTTTTTTIATTITIAFVGVPIGNSQRTNE